MTNRLRILSAAMLWCSLNTGTLWAQLSPPDYRGFGSDGKTFATRCFDNGFWVSLFFRDVCEGYPPTTLPWQNTPNSQSDKLLAWLGQLEWSDASDTVRRMPYDDQLPKDRWSLMKVASITSPRDFRFANVPARGAVLGRITVEQSGQPDVRYGIGGLGSSYGKHFYIVTSGFVARDEREPDNIDAVGPSRLISGWYILGVKIDGGDSSLVRVGNTGTIRWCGHGHIVDTSKDYPADFLKCNAQAAYNSIRSDRELVQALKDHASNKEVLVGGAAVMSTSWLKIVGTSYEESFMAASPLRAQDLTRLELLRSFLRWHDPFSDPVWMTCGVGCCIAET